MSRGRGSDNGFRSCSQRPDDSYVKSTQLDEHAAVAVADSDVDKDFQNQAFNFDWSSVGPFHYMNNTFSLLPSIQGEHVDSTVKGKTLNEDHSILSAIAETDDTECYYAGVIVVELPNDCISSQEPYDDDNDERSQIDSKVPKCGFVLPDNVSNRADYPHYNFSNHSRRQWKCVRQRYELCFSRR